MVCYYSGAISLGLILGVMLLFGLVLFIQRIEQYKFRQYLSECDDAKRKDIKKDLDDILKLHDQVAEKTNTLVFKRKTNAIRDFICFLEKYRTN